MSNEVKSETKESPRFIHDCERCTFLGRFDGKSHFNTDIKSDLYHCENSYGGSVISRYSDDGPEYSSSPLSCLPKATLMLDLGEARRRWEALNSKKDEGQP